MNKKIISLILGTLLIPLAIAVADYLDQDDATTTASVNNNYVELAETQHDYGTVIPTATYEWSNSLTLTEDVKNSDVEGVWVRLCSKGEWEKVMVGDTEWQVGQDQFIQNSDPYKLDFTVKLEVPGTATGDYQGGLVFVSHPDQALLECPAGE